MPLATLQPPPQRLPRLEPDVNRRNALGERQHAIVSRRDVGEHAAPGAAGRRVGTAREAALGARVVADDDLPGKGARGERLGALLRRALTAFEVPGINDRRGDLPTQSETPEIGG